MRSAWKGGGGWRRAGLVLVVTLVLGGCGRGPRPLSDATVTELLASYAAEDHFGLRAQLDTLEDQGGCCPLRVRPESHVRAGRLYRPA